ncbi:MAG: nitrogenase component 1 [Myxococcota bacterium]|nr:nitrogenase component 1 [Myxococcota bacterium]
MCAKPASGMDDFGIPYDFSAPYLDGVYLAVNAIPDAYLIHDAHDCGYYNAERIAAGHDLLSSLMRWEQLNRVVRTNLDSPDYIMGGGDKLSKKLLQVGERYRPAIMFVARSNVVIATGHDATPVIRDLERKLGIPLVLIPDRNVEKDFIAGYLDALTGLFSHLPSRSRRDDRRSGRRVAVAGYVFDRNEGDQRGNVQEIRRLLEGIGAEPGPFFLDGAAFARLSGFPVPGTVVDLASGWDGARTLAERWGAGYLPTALPVGLEGTAEWLMSVAGHLGLEDQARKFVDGEVGELAPMLQWLLPRYFSGRGVLVFADRLLLPPLVRFLEDLGMLVAGAGCTSAGGGGRAADAPLPGNPRQVPRRMADLRRFVGDARHAGEVDLIIGNSIIRQVARGSGVPFVELGYPSNFHHVLFPSPYLGFSGVRVLVQRMINAMERPAEEGETGCA